MGQILAITGLLLLALVPHFFSLKPDYDLWWHVRLGLDILESGVIIMPDTYSYASGVVPWVNHEWLAELMLAHVYEWGGGAGLHMFRSVLLIALAFALFVLLRCLWEQSFFSLLFLVVFPLPIVAYFANLRPHTLTFLLLVIFLLIFEAYRRGHTRWIWLIPILMVLWVNLHGGFLIGLGLAGIGLFSLIYDTDGLGDVPSAAERSRLCTVGVLTLAAVLVNPYRTGLLTYLVREMGSTHAYLGEWKPIHGLQYLHWAYVAIIPLVAMWLAREWRHRTLVLFFVLTGIATLTSNRFFVFFTIIGSLCFFSALPGMWQRFRAKNWPRELEDFDKPKSWAFLFLCLSFVSLSGFRQYGQNGLQLPVNAEKLPVEAVEVLKEESFGERVILPLHWGGYAVWHLKDLYLIGIDGRYLTVYDPNYVDSYIGAYREGKLNELLQLSPADILLVEHDHAMANAARSSEQWTEVYRDGTASIFLLDTPAADNFENKDAAHKGYYFP